MVSSINANSLNQITNVKHTNVKPSTSVIADNEKVSQKNSTNSTEENVVATSEDGDTVSISNSGSVKAAKKTFTATSKQGTVTEDKGYTDSVASALSSAAASAGIDSNTQVKNSNATTAAVSSSSSSSSSSDTSNLSQYTEYQLKEMLRDGEITQAEYDDEISNRENNSETTEVSSESAKSVPQNTVSNIQNSDPTSETIAAQQAGIIE